MTFTRSSLLVLPLLASCALAPTTSGKYLHVMDPANVQIAFPSANVCALSLKIMGGREKGRETARLSRCTETSLSQEMRFKATLFEKRNRYSYDVETRTLALCQQTVADIMSDSKSDANAVLAPCAAK